MRHYIGTREQCETADLVISTNCNWPVGGTNKWAEPKETATEGVFAIPVPEGSHGFTFGQMNEGVVLPIDEAVEFPEVEGE